MEPIIWISFDDTVPVPALAAQYAVSRESLIDLFERGRELTQLKFTAHGAWIMPEDEDDWDKAEPVARIEVEGVDFYTFQTAGFEFNDDTEPMLELGYRAAFIPGGGIVVENPATPATLAADRILNDLGGHFGRYAPERVSSWAEYASAVPNLERVFALAGVERHEKEKQAAVGARVDVFLAARAAALPTEGTVRADELEVGMTLDPTDVRWWSWHPVRELFFLTAVVPAENGMLKLTVQDMYDRPRTSLVRPDRRFLVARKG